ncbi:MAG: GNAT family N-acetyltransferase [Erysipelotrichaceae bacterium]|nr:GNAT family N-acetyltransferase [Erysipelotrichaceae bacterium]
MIITKAEIKDICDIMYMVNDAKAFLKSQGVNQWQDGYPNEESFENDIKENRLYVVKEGDLVLGVFALVDYEQTYDVIYEGTWSKDLPYIAAHRICVNPDYKGKGVARFIFDELKKKYSYIRVDTHRHNVNMNKCLINNGFSKRGSIYLNSESDNHRVAYDFYHDN